MKPVMPLEGLLFTQDEQMELLLGRVCEDFSIETRVCRDMRSCTLELQKRKHDCVIVDWNESEIASQLTAATRESALNKRTFVMALVQDAMALKTAFALNASLVSYRPCSNEQAMRTFRPAYAFMLRQRRATFRHQVNMVASLRLHNGNTLAVAIKNISQGGAGMHSPLDVEIGETVTLGLTLPGTKLSVTATSRVLWSDKRGKIGVKFMFMPPAERDRFNQWLDSEMEKLGNLRMYTGALSMAGSA